jgi:hypothetical protein
MTFINVNNTFLNRENIFRMRFRDVNKAIEVYNKLWKEVERIQGEKNGF